LPQAELAWLLLWLLCVVAIVIFPAWQVIALLLATIFVALAWQANRSLAARDRARVAAEADRLLQLQRQFLQDASHQLRTPITIALGHAELLAGALAGRQQRDLGMLAAELLLRWQPVAARRWRLGLLEPVTAEVDAVRLELALDALVENAVRHTGPQDEITVSVLSGDGDTARIVVADTGEGIAALDVPHIFDRFATSGGNGARGTGLGLALVRAVARGHGGDVTVISTPGQGSRFELSLPVRQAHCRQSLPQQSGAS
jgi:signal transduction histidine kinase